MTFASLHLIVMPAEAGIQSGGLNNLLLGPRFRGDDEKVGEDGTTSEGLRRRPRQSGWRSPL